MLDDQVQHAKLELGDYSEFYSHLAIQARRASRVALLACTVALVALISAILAQLKPPILLRVQDGRVASLDSSGVELAQTAAEQQSSESEKLAFISSFLDRFVNVDPVTVKRNTTLALNQMTNTLRQHMLRQLNEQRFVDQVHENNITATLAVKSAELVAGDPYTAVVFGQKRVTALTNGQESKKELLVKYVLRLAPVPRASATVGLAWKSLTTKKRY
jgi:hypothetical protein